MLHTEITWWHQYNIFNWTNPNKCLHHWPLNSASAISQGHSLVIIPTAVRVASGCTHRIIWFPSLSSKGYLHHAQQNQNVLQRLLISHALAPNYSLASFLMTLFQVHSIPTCHSGLCILPGTLEHWYGSSSRPFFPWGSHASPPCLIHPCPVSKVMSSEMPFWTNLTQHSVYNLADF